MTNREVFRLGLMKRRLEKAIAHEVRKRVPDVVRLTRLKALRLDISHLLTSKGLQPAFA
jgi:hypothetical protein